MTVPVEQLKERVHDHWDEIPVWFQAGERLDGLEEYSLDYFERTRQFRYVPERFRCILDFVDFAHFRQRLVLEIGCGQGCDLVEFARAGAHVIGSDLSIRNCLVAQKRLRAYGLSGQLVTLDAESIPFADESVDDIYSFGVLHHTPRMHDAFKEVERVLKPGGSLTMMLYRRSYSLWKWQCTYLGWLFMRTVRSDSWKRFYRWMGEIFRIKSFLTDELLDRYQELARRRTYSREEICAFMTDGPTNPLSQFVDPPDIKRGFPGLVPERFYNCYLGPIPVVNKILPAGFRRLVARWLGGFLFFRLRKPRGNAQVARRAAPPTLDEFRELLVDPVLKRPLRWHDDLAQAENGDCYPIVSGVPLLRTEARVERPVAAY
jgi:ubiquinone/menaquinone biosynthesis C-methylase UbiE